MSSTRTTVIVFGATGRVGGEVVRQLLLQPNTRVIAAVRNVSKYKGDAVVPAVQADLTDPASISQAVQQSQADRAFLYVTGGDMKEAVAALKAAGVRHVVLLSSWTVQPEYVEAHDAIARRHFPVEESIRASGLTWTFLRGGVFASNVFSIWRRAIATGELRVAHPDFTSTMVAHEDIAAVAVKALTSAELDNQAVTVVGPRPLSMHEVMAIVSRALGRAITVTEVSEAEWREMLLPAGLPPPIIDSFLRGARDKNPQKEGSPAAAERAMGRPATTFEQYMERHKGELGPHS